MPRCRCRAAARSRRERAFLQTEGAHRARRVQSLHGLEDRTVNEELREEWSDYLEQTHEHERIVATVLEELGVEEEEL